MLDKNLEARTELTSMSYAAEVFLRMLNLYRGSYYKLRNAGPILSDEEQIPRAELRAALDYLQESGYIAARTVKDHTPAHVSDLPLEDMECKLQTLPLKGKRSYGKIASLPPEVRNAVDNMILSCTVRIPEIQAYIQEKADVSVSESTVSRYGKRLADSYRDLMIAQESFESLRKEVEKYPEQDAAEVLLRIAIHKMMVALTSKTDEDWNEMRVDKLMREISGVTRAVAYKQRVDMQNKDVVTAALDEVQASVFSALAQEQPELYRQVAKFIERKKKEGL